MSPKSHINQIVLFGDSLTQFGFGEKGVVGQLAHRYQRRFDVLSRGFSGYNTEWAVQMASLTIPELKRIKLFILWLGANDQLLPPLPRAVTPERYKENLSRIISLVPDDAKIILMSPPAYAEKGKAKDFKLTYYPGIPLDRDPIHNVKYHEKMKELALELDSGIRKGKVAYCDTRLPMEKGALEACPGDLQEGLFKYLHDGVHLTPEGYQSVFDSLISTVQERFPELDEEPMLFDDFETVDHAHPENYFEEMI